MIDELRHILSFSDAPLYNIKAVVQKTAIQTSTLRAWERRYGIPSPERSAHGHRLYSPRDLAIINWLRQRVEEGMSIGHAVALLQQSSGNSSQEAHFEETGSPDTPVDLQYIKQQLVRALLNYDLRHAHILVNNAVAICPLEQVIIGLFMPVLTDLGRLWADGNGTVAQEHFGSNFIRQRLLGLFQIYSPLSMGPRMVCACAEGELHELGLIMFSLLLQQRGWETIYLGQSTPLDGLEDCLRTSQPDVVCLSASTINHIEQLVQTGHMIDQLRLISSPILTFSGRTFDRIGVDIDTIPGVYLGTDMIKAVDLICSLVEQPQQMMRRRRISA